MRRKEFALNFKISPVFGLLKRLQLCNHSKFSHNPMRCPQDDIHPQTEPSTVPTTESTTKRNPKQNHPPTVPTRVSAHQARPKTEPPTYRSNHRKRPRSAAQNRATHLSTTSSVSGQAKLKQKPIKSSSRAAMVPPRRTDPERGSRPALRSANPGPPPTPTPPFSLFCFFSLFCAVGKRPTEQKREKKTSPPAIPPDTE